MVDKKTHADRMKEAGIELVEKKAAETLSKDVSNFSAEDATELVTDRAVEGAPDHTSAVEFHGSFSESEVKLMQERFDRQQADLVTRTREIAPQVLRRLGYDDAETLFRDMTIGEAAQLVSRFLDELRAGFEANVKRVVDGIPLEENLRLQKQFRLEGGEMQGVFGEKLFKDEDAAAV